MSAPPRRPLPVVVEHCAGLHNPILEGNKRCSAVALADLADLPTPCEALVGRTSLT
jgi:hypothetical protein